MFFITCSAILSRFHWSITTGPSILFNQFIGISSPFTTTNLGQSHLQKPFDLWWHSLQRVRAVRAAVGPLIHTLRHEDVPVLVDGVRLCGLRHDLVHGLREDADVAPRVLSDTLQELLVDILILHTRNNILHPKSHVCVRKVGKRGAKEKELNVVVVRSWYMEHVIQLDLDRAYLPVRDILL